MSTTVMTMSSPHRASISAIAPSVHLQRLQAEKQVQLTDEQMNEILVSHALNPNLLRADKYYEFIADRRTRLSQIVSTAMGKQISTIPEGGEYVQNDEEDSI
jgi:hypothetical protein